MQFNARQKFKCFASAASHTIKLDDKLKINENLFLSKTHKTNKLFEVDHYYYWT